MNYRHSVLMAAQDLGPSGTKLIDVDVADPISMITIRHVPTGGSATPVAHPIKNIERIELVDGSDVLYSLTGFEGQALNVLEAEKPVICEIDHRAGGTSLMYVNLMFGRRLWDEVLALDPKQFGNLQLKIKWNEVNYDASCSSHSFMVFAHLFDQKTISPMGFFMNKEQKSYTPSSGSWEYTSLPTDYPIRKLILKGLKDGQGVRGLIEDFKLDEDNDKRILIDGDIHELRSFLDSMNGEAVDVVRCTATTASKKHFCTASNLYSAIATGDTAAKVIIISGASGGRFNVKGEAAAGVAVFVRGKNPHGCICIPFGNQDDPADWWNTPALGNARLSVKGGGGSASGDTVDVVTQQLRPY